MGLEGFEGEKMMTELSLWVNLSSKRIEINHCLSPEQKRVVMESEQKPWVSEALNSAWHH